jgi:3-dehydro-L-gulonate 2-dehydrogenase
MRIPIEQLHKELMRVLMNYGFASDRAELCARLFAEASRDGVHSHGLNRFPRFIEWIQKGLVKVDAIPHEIEKAGVLEKWDGNLGPGNLNAFFGMGRAIAVAKESGIGCIALRNTNHWMRGGSYGWQAAEAGCIGICWTNTIPNLPPWGAKESKLGNNPFIMAVPRQEGHIVLDMAMSQFSYGKLESMRMKGEQLPVDGGFDANGKLTRDPKAIEESGRPLPIGYWKGSGLSLILDLTATILSGGLSTRSIGQLEVEYSVSQVFIAIDPTKISERIFIQQAVEEIIQDFHAALPDTESGMVFYPGEKTLAVRMDSLQYGVPVDESIWKAVLAL